MTTILPWEVKGKIYYEILTESFGTQPLSKELLDRFQTLIGKDLHPWLRNGVILNHSYFETILDAIEKKEDIFLLLSKSPSKESLHLGHLIPFQFAKWLQEVLNCFVVIQISDEGKSALSNLPFETVYQQGIQNAQEIIALGFNSSKTFIFSTRDYHFYTPEFESLIYEASVRISRSFVDGLYGFDQTANVSLLQYPLYQAVAAFSQSYPHLFPSKKPAHCLIISAFDEYPFFQLADEISKQLTYLTKPSTLVCKFVDPLDGSEGKMSSSTQNAFKTTLYLSDTPNQIGKKLKSSKSGARGNGSKEDHERLGGDIEEDAACQLLQIFDNDDEGRKELLDNFSKGKAYCGDTKNRIVPIITNLVQSFQDSKKAITNEIVKSFYSKENKEI
jgi:tryptophanyl-tRNA synthetase